MSITMYIPKKLKWDSLTEFRKFLLRETKEKIVSFNGFKLITETTEYGIVDSTLVISEISITKKKSKKKAK